MKTRVAPAVVFLSIFTFGYAVGMATCFFIVLHILRMHR
jgi:hypothetical protein